MAAHEAAAVALGAPGAPFALARTSPNGSTVLRARPSNLQMARTPAAAPRPRLPRPSHIRTRWQVAVYFRGQATARFKTARTSDGRGVRISVDGGTPVEVFIGPSAYVTQAKYASKCYLSSGTWVLTWPLGLPVNAVKVGSPG